ncbi:hypothetical protein AUJ65_05630 [Candidatus Micrarchaeota archaeon CG1_02_51_15]|nr:MAG: hypothetical protein AUJ65_05630 [Candidatus Micrarchaeota archaeon CG1_02_51_15]
MHAAATTSKMNGGLEEKDALSNGPVVKRYHTRLACGNLRVQRTFLLIANSRCDARSLFAKSFTKSGTAAFGEKI